MSRALELQHFLSITGSWTAGPSTRYYKILCRTFSNTAHWESAWELAEPLAKGMLACRCALLINSEDRSGTGQHETGMPYTEGRLRGRVCFRRLVRSQRTTWPGPPSQRGAPAGDKVQSKMKFLVGLFLGWDKRYHPGHFPWEMGGVEGRKVRIGTEKWFCMSYRVCGK